MRDETPLVAHDVLDVLGADVAGLHDLTDGAGGGDRAEDLDEEDCGRAPWLEASPPCWMMVSTGRAQEHDRPAGT